MKRVDIKLIISLLVFFVIYLTNFFVFKVNNIYVSLMGVFTVGVITHILVGFEKERLFDKKKIIIYTLFYTLSFLSIKYAFGVKLGFLSNPYNLSYVYKFIIPYAIVIVISELIRYTINNRSDSKLVFILNILLLAFIDITCLYNFDVIDSTYQLFIFLATTVSVCLFKSIGLSLISRRYGYISTIIYSLVFSLYVYIIPIQPNLGDYVNTVYQILIPIFMYLLLNLALEKYVLGDIRKKHVIPRFIRLLIIIIMITIAALNSNYFRYWIAVVGSGSMSPTIDKGDIILVDKSYKERVDEIKVGDILVFDIEGTIYTHRVIDINKNDENISISTQGDRENQAIDKWVVRKDNIIGITITKFKYIGKPAIFIKELMEG